MAEFLFQGLNETASLRYWRGDCIQSYPDGSFKEPPSAGRLMLSVPGLDLELSNSWLAEWFLRFDVSVVSSDLPNDAFRMQVQATEYNPNSGIGKITRNRIESYLNRWNATVFSISDNTVVFDVTILDAIRSERFWRNIDITGATLTQQSYTQGNGNHRCRSNYSATELRSTDVEAAITSNGGSIVNHNVDTKIVTFDVTRADVNASFQADLKELAEQMVQRRKFRISEAACQAIEAAGGWLTITEAEWNTYWQNKLQE